MGRAAQSGFLAAHYANETLTGDQRIFGDRYGSVGPTLSGDGGYDTEQTTEGLGDEYRIVDSMHLKPFPSIISIHAPVAGVRDLLNEYELDPATVDSVTVWTSRASKEHVGWEYEPTGVMSAQGNIQYGIASLLEDGELTINAYTPEAIRRPTVVDRTNDIEILVDEKAGKSGSWSSKIEVRTSAGDTYSTTVDAPPGSPQNRLSQTELETKFKTQATEAISEEKADGLLEFIENIEDKPDVREIFDFLT
jgi:2-methylcitrate dehydratase PrpD